MNMVMDGGCERLKLANKHVAEGEQRVAAQFELLARLERGGHNSLQAGKLLRQFEETLALYVEARDCIAKELREGK